MLKPIKCKICNKVMQWQLSSEDAMIHCHDCDALLLFQIGIVMPNSLASSQATINLKHSFSYSVLLNLFIQS